MSLYYSYVIIKIIDINRNNILWYNICILNIAIHQNLGVHKSKKNYARIFVIIIKKCSQRTFTNIYLSQAG